jgi:hypothetical protein
MKYVMLWTDAPTFHQDLPCIPLHYTYAHFTSSPQFTSLHFTSLPFPSLPIPSLDFTSLHFPSLHFTSLHFTSDIELYFGVLSLLLWFILRRTQQLRLCSVEWQDKGWIMNWKGFGRKQSWPKRGTFPKFTMERLRKATRELRIRGVQPAWSCADSWTALRSIAPDATPGPSAVGTYRPELCLFIREFLFLSIFLT